MKKLQFKFMLSEGFYIEKYKKKLCYLTADNRPFKRRLLISLLLGFTFSFSFIAFGIFDIFISNRKDYPVVFSDFYLEVLAVAFVAFVGISGALLIFKGKLFNIFSSLILGVIIVGYLQGTLLNSNIGMVTGDRIFWELMWRRSLLNTAVWAVVIPLPAIICYFNKKIWYGMTIFLPVLLIGMQLSALVIPFVTTNVLTEKKSMSVISTKGSYDVSSKENIIVFVLDRLDYNYVEEIIETSGFEFFEPLDGFTFFKNATSPYTRTLPSVTYYLTGEKYFFDVPVDKYFDHAWSNGKFIPELKKNNYSVNLYLEKGTSFSNINQVRDMTENIIETKITVRKTYLLKRLIFLSLYRYSPDVMKPSFWNSSTSLNKSVSAGPENLALKSDDYLFYQNLLKSGLKVRDDKNVFVYHHLRGSHTPCTLNENIEPVPNNTVTPAEQTKGCFKILYEYFSQLKKLGLYENSTILIFGDHGYTTNIVKLRSPHTIGMFVKPKGSAGAPMKVSSAPVSQENFQATVLKSAGLNYEAFGQSMFDIREDSDNVREFYNLVTPGKNNDILERFSIKGDAHNFSNWTKLGESDANSANTIE